MALDQQSNWDIQMSQPFKTPLPTRNRQTRPVPVPFIPPPSPSNREVLLPVEIISQILTYIPLRASFQYTLWSCTLVSRAWYTSSIVLLYNNPHLTGSNFNLFVSTICPSKNAHIRHSALAPLVHTLNMGELVHDSSRSLTARMLGRLKGNLQTFVAPQASFAINSFAALSKCTLLKHLDLSLISASISHRLLFQTLKSLNQLETLFFPRSSSLDTVPLSEQKEEPYSWPPHLKALHLAGGINDYFLLTHLFNTPETLRKLSIQHCSQVYGAALLAVLRFLGPRLTHLTIRHPMTKLQHGALDTLLSLCPYLLALRVSADYISSGLLSSINLPDNQTHPLQILDLECSPQASADVGENQVDAGLVYSYAESGKLGDLRSVRVSARLAWLATKGTRQDVSDLMEVMEENDMENPLGIEIGVWASLPD